MPRPAPAYDHTDAARSPMIIDDVQPFTAMDFYRAMYRVTRKDPPTVYVESDPHTRIGY